MFSNNKRTSKYHSENKNNATVNISETGELSTSTAEALVTTQSWYTAISAMCVTTFPMANVWI